MAVFVEREGIESCMTKIAAAIDQLKQAAESIDKTMAELPNYWQGDAYNKAEATYAEQYQTLLKTTVPTQVDEFKQFMDNCKKTIIDIDTQLAGG